MTESTQPTTFNPRAHELLEAFIAQGFCDGAGKNGEVCIMQAINLAERGLSDAKGIGDITDTADCVATAAREFAIRMNDAAGYYWYGGGWSSKAARGKGLAKLAHALLGSRGVDAAAWKRAVARRFIMEILPIAARKLAELKRYEPSKSALLGAARRVEEEGTREAARAVGDAARAARREADSRPPAVADAVADAAAADAVAWLVKYREAYAPQRDAILTRCANIAADELEISKAARDAKVSA